MVIFGGVGFLGVAALAVWRRSLKQAVTHFVFECTLTYKSLGPPQIMATEGAKTSGERALREGKRILRPPPPGPIHSSFRPASAGGERGSAQPPPPPPSGAWWSTVGWVVMSPSAPGQASAGDP